MLSTALMPLKIELFNALKSEDVADVFATAFKSTIPSPADLGNEVENQQLKQMIDDSANQFGKLCADGLAGVLAGPMGDAIDHYVKQIGIMATVGPTVANTAGPCSGIIAPTDFQIL